MTNGWIKLHKKIKDWEWYGDPATRGVFIHLLLSVNYEKGYWRGIEILAGQAPIGRKQLARDLGFSEQQIRRALNNLQNSQQITIKSTNKHSVVTVCQWESYQSVNEKAPTNQPQNNHETNRKTTTLKEVKKKEDKNNTPLPPIPEFINPDIWSKWIQHRKEIKKPLKPTQTEGQIKKLSKFREDGYDVNEIIETSIDNGWQGLFKPKQRGKQNGYEYGTASKNVIRRLQNAEERADNTDGRAMLCDSEHLRQNIAATGNFNDGDG